MPFFVLSSHLNPPREEEEEHNFDTKAILEKFRLLEMAQEKNYKKTKELNDQVSEVKKKDMEKEIMARIDTMEEKATQMDALATEVAGLKELIKNLAQTSGGNVTVANVEGLTTKKEVDDLKAAVEKRAMKTDLETLRGSRGCKQGFQRRVGQGCRQVGSGWVEEGGFRQGKQRRP